MIFTTQHFSRRAEWVVSPRGMKAHLFLDVERSLPVVACGRKLGPHTRVVPRHSDFPACDDCTASKTGQEMLIRP
jgi:hypothetical protein